ncbi:hypothetical protein ARTHRO9V_280305 [Arthrobacter sp. 9V]|nr:hypothetical protein ARTHRO9V_280305 [Arthrobacter sp. 9V]
MRSLSDQGALEMVLMGADALESRSARLMYKGRVHAGCLGSMGPDLAAGIPLGSIGGGPSSPIRDAVRPLLGPDEGETDPSGPLVASGRY